MARRNESRMAVQIELDTNEVASEGRLRIIAAARPLFVEHGYKGVSMQQIADAACIHKATVYHHFRDKDALFAAVVQAELKQMRAELVDAIDAGETARQRLAAVGWAFFQRSRGDFGQLMSDVHTHLPESYRAQVMREQTFPWEQLEGIFAEAATRDDLPPIDPSLAATLFAGVIWGQIWARKVERVSEPLTPELADRLVDILLAGLANAPAALA